MPMVVSGLPRYTSETNWMDGFEIPAHVCIQSPSFSFPQLFGVPQNVDITIENPMRNREV